MMGDAIVLSLDVVVASTEMRTANPPNGEEHDNTDTKTIPDVVWSI